MSSEIKIISAFTKNGKGGNLAAVVLHADDLDTHEKQSIAAKVGLSETAFVSSSEEADFKLDFFTPVRQIRHCGHATIATFSYLKQIGKIKSQTSSKMTVDGPRKIAFQGEEAFMEQLAPTYSYLDHQERQEIINSLGIDMQDIILPTPIVVNTGNSFVIVEVKAEGILRTLKPDFRKIALISEQHGAIGFYVFVRKEFSEVDATTRMFAPAYGIEEDSATGMAAGPLACYLFKSGIHKRSFRFEQGRFMKKPSPSLIKVELNNAGENILSLFAGGAATLIQEVSDPRELLVHQS